MASVARSVIPGLTHHMTQRGNGRTQAFFSNDDYLADCTPMVRQRN